MREPAPPRCFASRRLRGFPCPYRVRHRAAICVAPNPQRIESATFLILSPTLRTHDIATRLQLRARAGHQIREALSPRNSGVVFMPQARLQKT